jgi:aspartate/methionine/tyrosine aminotransferase
MSSSISSAVAARLERIPPSATVQLADLASQLRRAGADVIDFSAGRAAEHTPSYICEAAARALAEGDTHQTMAQGTPAFRAACAGKLARDNAIDADPDAHIIATMGCKEGLLLALLTTVDHGDEVIVEDPCFVSYQPEVHLAGATPVPVPLRSAQRFRWTEDDLERAVTPRTRAILMCSPHNPTGAVHTPNDLDAIAAVARRHDLMVISDETYERLTWHGRRHTCIATREGMRERTVGLMGMTKAFSMGGWRIGFNYAPEALIRAMVVVQQHLVTCASSFAQRGAALAVADPLPTSVTDLWKDWEARCDHAVSKVNEIPGLSCERPEAGFYAWIDISARGEPSAGFTDRLLRDHHVAMVPGSAFGPHGEGYVRMTCVRSWDELREGLGRLREAAAGSR